MSDFLSLISMSVLVEGLISWVDAFATADKQAKVKLGASIIAGLLISVSFNFDIMGILGYTSAYPLVGNVITGLLIARGSNYFFDLVGKLTNGGGSTVVTAPAQSTVTAVIENKDPS
jgi:hypothetical protein